MGKNRDPHYMHGREGMMLSLHGRAKHQEAEDSDRFNAATMGNRRFKNLPKVNRKGSNYAKAAQRKLKGKF